MQHCQTDTLFWGQLNSPQICGASEVVRSAPRLRLLFRPIEPIDEIAHLLVQGVVPTSVGCDEDADKQNGQADLHHRGLPAVRVGPAGHADQPCKPVLPISIVG